MRCVVLGLALCALCGCGGGDPGRISLELRFVGLPDLGPRGGTYEGWLMAADAQVFSVGKFRIDSSTTPARVVSPSGRTVFGTVDAARFGPSNTELGEDFPFVQGALQYFVTIEPEGDFDDVPSDTLVLAGLFGGTNSAALSTSVRLSQASAGIGDLSFISGTALLANPTGGGDPRSGVWFVQDASGQTPSLFLLPPANPGFRYEAWVERGSERYSLGKFDRPQGLDSDALTSLTRGPNGVGFRFPGQDFVQSAQIPGTEVLDLASGEVSVEITLEPEPDHSADPFPFVVLAGQIPVGAVTANTGAGQGDIAMVAPGDLPRMAAAGSSLGWIVTTSGLPPLDGSQGSRYVLFARVGQDTVRLISFLVDEANGLILGADGSTVLGRTDFFGIDATVTGLGATFPNPLNTQQLLLAVEPSGDTLSAPLGGSVLLGADLLQGSGVFSLTEAAAGGVANGSLEFRAGRFVLRSPTDDLSNTTINDRNGIYFRAQSLRRLADGTLSSAGLILPPTRQGWRYEGWVIDRATNRRFSTGRFSNPLAADEDSASFAGAGSDRLLGGFSVPGQDFVRMTAPTTQNGPILFDSSWDVVVTIEPDPDTGAAPYGLEILRGPLPNAAFTPSAPLVNRTANFPTGTCSYQP